MAPILRFLSIAALLSFALPGLAQSISGTVFEDVNYGGGAGRSLTAANAVLPGSAAPVTAAATVELYDAGGAYLRNTTTNTTNGQYQFSGLTAGASYIVRVVNSTVRSTRPGSTGGLVPVQTYVVRNGTPDLNRVGGEVPGAADGPAITTVGTQISTITAQSQAPVTVAGTTAVTGIDFGFNFDVITNTNNAGQGSLRQFLFNATALGNATLRQQGLAPRRETSVFMIPDGAAHPGLRAGLTDQLTGAANARRALITLSATLTAISDAGTVLDATTQTINVGNTNTLLLGTGGTVGTDRLGLSKVNGPEVELAVNVAGATGLSFTGDSCVMRGLAVHGGATGVNFGGRGAVLESNLIGVTALAVQLPTSNAVSGVGLVLSAPTGLMQNNLVGYCGSSGLNYSAGTGTTGFVVRNNEFVQNGQVTAGGDGLSIGDQGAAGPVLIEGNLIALSNSSGIQLEIGRISNNIIRSNTIRANGTGGAATRLEGSGIHYLARTNVVSSTNTDLIFRNLITENQSSGVVVNYGQRNVQISQNSIFLNGNQTIPGAAGLLSIDFTGPNGYVSGDANYGQGDGVTPNDGTLSLTSRQGNGGIDYPVLTSISREPDGRLRVQGYVGSAAGQTQFGGATIEIFSANNNDNNQKGPIVTGDGKSVDHGEAQSYVGTITADANANFNAVLPSVATNINSGDIVTATAYLSGYGTSECGVNLVSNFQVLPVQLTRFAAVVKGQQVLLDWATAAELHNDRFEVERSIDGVSFTTVTRAPGLGTASQGRAYSFLDTPPAGAPATLYYRLRQVDTDGTASYSTVQAVQWLAPTAALTISPNPATSYIVVDMSQMPAGSYRFQLRDARGGLVQDHTRQARRAPLHLDLQRQPAGLYLLTIEGAGQFLTRRLIKEQASN